ncbi:MAG: ATP-binding cassette domain-containing protein [Oscillospiraceae bacterium]|nr:ATP-binding cassette domain-containing protein [Oscillospiraceae bacterium]
MDRQQVNDPIRKNRAPNKIQVRHARVHNLKNIDVDIPLNQIVGVAGVSGSGKSSLALGVLYAEGSRRYLDALSAYTRRRMTQAARAEVDEVLYIPAALALHQRPGVPGIRSTFGTGTELLNSLRLMYSRLASHCCPNGHYLQPSLAVAAGHELVCPECGERFFGLSAEELAFNSQGACRTCGGTGVVRTVDQDTLVPDESLTIDEGAVAPWNTLMWSLMTDVCRAMGVRTDVPFSQLTAKEREIVFHGPAEKKHIFYKPKNGSNQAGELDFTYFNANYTVENALAKVKDEKGMKRVEKYLKQGVCPECGGCRLCAAARRPKLRGISLEEACKMPLGQLVSWVDEVPGSLPMEMRVMAEAICESFQAAAKRLMDLGLGYLSLDRAAATLSTGERQRMQLARAVRNRTTGVLYVLDEPSIGLHPSNIVGLTGVMRDLIADGNSVVLVDHDTQILSEADWIVELGPQAGAEGGQVIAQGTVPAIKKSPVSQIGPFLSGEYRSRMRKQVVPEELFDLGKIHLSTGEIHTVKPLEADIPQGRLTVITGVSGSGKTTLVLESLIPGLEAAIAGRKLPGHVKQITAEQIRRVKLIDATPIGVNVRSTVATYANVHDELRKIYARTPHAKALQYKAGDFSYNTGRLRCPTCDGTGSISLDVQFLPDVEITCPECRGSRYAGEAEKIKRKNKAEKEYSLPEIMAMDVKQALTACEDLKTVSQRLQVLQDLGLGYLTLGEETPSLSGGEAQRLKLASEMGRQQAGTVFVFDEPTIGLHPLDVCTLLSVFDRLVAYGATVIVIEHDLDVIANADYLIDMGPGGGAAGGCIVATGTPGEVAANPQSITGKYLKSRI